MSIICKGIVLKAKEKHDGLFLLIQVQAYGTVKTKHQHIAECINIQDSCLTLSRRGNIHYQRLPLCIWVGVIKKPVPKFKSNKTEAQNFLLPKFL